MQCLVAAHQSWSDAIIALDPLFADPQQDATICRMLTEAMQRRTRLSCLLQELEREQLVAYQQIYQQHEVAIYAFGKEG